MSQDLAHSLLQLRFDADAESRIHALLQKDREETITASEAGELENYRRVGQLLDLLQAKARVSLRDSTLSQQ